VLYFRLIVKTGAARTMTLTYLIPLFANLIGVFVLDEIVTGTMLLAGVVILLGTAMASGLFPRQGLP
jgi:drug/metabolite transporter (DMT)-like permease